MCESGVMDNDMGRISRAVKVDDVAGIGGLTGVDFWDR